MNIPRIVIGGTNSGCGKTTISAGIMAALVKRGLRIQPYKVGPDYIDPMFHTYITGRDSRNLDSFLMNEEILPYLFERNSKNADICIVEGVMGLYDGYGGYSQTASTAHVSKIISSPVILIINGEGMSLSIVPFIKGFMDFDREVNIKGVIINGIRSESHFSLLKKNIEDHTGIRVLGYLKRMEEYTFPSRHLGLVQGEEINDIKNRISALAEEIEKTIELDEVIKIASEAENLKDYSFNFNIAKRKYHFRIGVAKDKAFNFYYKDNLELLEMLGAELTFFSPLSDSSLPENIDGLYIGGGYPEVFAKELQDNIPMRECIKKTIEEGLPAYAECGGMMYLSQSIRTLEGKEYGMVGIVPGQSEMTSKLQRFGYVDIEITGDNVLSKKGYRIKAHEFHYSTTTIDWNVPTCFKISKKKKDKEPVTWHCGYKLHNLLAGYPHLHFWGNTGFAEKFINRCIQHQIEGGLKSI